ncbi:MAG: leucine dehydrogenase [Bdellovibrionales bacterium]|nr:leucine dehydrogenase [Bdellovibrionales bacterium]
MNMKTVCYGEHESVHFYSDESVGLFAIIAVHTTFSGCSLGGCRIKSFSSEKEAIQEVLRLSEHMTYKSLLCDLKMGGGKSVIVAGPNFKKTPQLLKSFANAVNSLGGQYIVSVDMGSDSDDMEFIKQTTDYVIGYDQNKGGAGDPGVYTARGVLAGMKTALQEKWSTSSFKDRKICVVGIGDVGRPLCQSLLEEGARLIVSDVDKKQIDWVKQFGEVEVVEPRKAHQVPCDIFSPCATGDVFTVENVKELNCQVIAGAANNQLVSEEVGKVLFQRDILYLPDFAVNAGGLVGVVLGGIRKENLEETLKKVDDIEELTRDILQRSEKEKKPTSQVALEMARKKYNIMYSKTRL